LKKFRSRLILIVMCALLVIFVAFACKDISLNNNDENVSEVLQDNPVHIAWIENKENLESYMADVDVFAMNSRRDTGAVQVDSYSMAVKSINSRMYTRIDSSRADSSGRFRSIATDGIDMVFFNPESSVVDLRMPVKNEMPQEFDFFSNEAMLSKINLSAVRNEAKRLSFSITEDANAGGLTLELPSRLFPQIAGENRISTKVVFDASKELLNHTEIITYLADGTKRTATSYPLYQEHNNTYVKTGTVHIIDYDVPYRYPGHEGAKIYNSPDDYPTITEKEYEKLAKEGKAFPARDAFFGDPADPSYTMTIIETYRNIEINTVQNSAFKVLGGF